MLSKQGVSWQCALSRGKLTQPVKAGGFRNLGDARGFKEKNVLCLCEKRWLW